VRVRRVWGQVTLARCQEWGPFRYTGGGKKVNPGLSWQVTESSVFYKSSGIYQVVQWISASQVDLCCSDSLGHLWLDPAIAQAVNRCLPTAAARVRARVSSSGICGGQSGAGAGFLRVFRLPLPVFIPPNSLSSQSPGTGTTGQKWPTFRVTQSELHYLWFV
jgi:hypothetical protein